MSSYYLVIGSEVEEEVRQLLEKYIKEMILQGYGFNLDAKENLNKIVKGYVSNKTI